MHSQSHFKKIEHSIREPLYDDTHEKIKCQKATIYESKKKRYLFIGWGYVIVTHVTRITQLFAMKICLSDVMPKLVREGVYIRNANCQITECFCVKGEKNKKRGVEKKFLGDESLPVKILVHGLVWSGLKSVFVVGGLSYSQSINNVLWN